jgi:hypothetical protein
MEVDSVVKNMFRDLGTIPYLIRFNYDFFLIKNESDLREFCLSVMQNNYDLINEIIEPDGSINNIEDNNNEIQKLQKAIIDINTINANKEFCKSLNYEIRSQIRKIEIENSQIKTQLEMYKFFISSYANVTTLELFQFLWHMKSLHQSFNLEKYSLTNLSCTEIPHEA